MTLKAILAWWLRSGSCELSQMWNGRGCEGTQTRAGWPVLERNWSAVAAITCGEHEIKCLFTAKDMTLRRAAKWTERRCLIDEGLAWVRYHDNNRQVQPHLHVSKVKNCDFRLGVFRTLSLTRSWRMLWVLLWLFLQLHLSCHICSLCSSNHSIRLTWP